MAILKRTIVGVILALLVFTESNVEASLPKKREYLLYDVKVFNVLKALEVRITFEPASQPDIFLAQLTLKPVGVLKFMLPYKSCEFRSQLRLMPDSKRLRPEVFEKILVSKRVYRGVYHYDYEKEVVVGQGFFDDRALKPEEFPLSREKGVYYDDFLSFLYNFRSGGYGDLKPGESVFIHTVPTRAKRTFELQVASDKIGSEFDPMKGAVYLMVLRLDEQFLGFHVDRFFLWLSQDYLPVYGVLKDVVGWGDVIGVFRGVEELT